MEQNTSPIIAKVCKTATSSVNRYDKKKDLLCAKITNIHADGTRSNSFIGIEDYKQPIWIVKEERRKFKQHKDYIEERHCKAFKVSRGNIPSFVNRHLYGKSDSSFDLSQAKSSPYVFGLDQTPAVHFKQKFHEKYGDYQDTEPYTLAAYDVEGDMTKEGVPIMMASVTFKKKAFFAACRSWYAEQAGHALTDDEILAALKEAEHKYLGDHLKRRSCVVEYLLVDTPGQVVKACIDKMHEWEPDWVAAWNAVYDMEANEKALREDGYDLADVYCDKRVPREYRHYKLDPGRTHKVKENGDRQPLEWQERFPTIRNQATWKFADAGSFFAIKRQPTQGKLESTSLQGVIEMLNNDKKPHEPKIEGKLYTKEGHEQGEGSAQWHRYMQKNYPYLYSMYNIADNFAIEEINEDTSDFSLSLPMLLKYSEFFNYVSQPKIISDTLAFVARERGFVWGSTPRVRDKSFTDRLPTLGDWIALLDTEKNASLGKALFVGLFDVISSGRTDTSDIDVEGAYPHAGLCLNVAAKTTMAEVYQIERADGMKLREIAVNYASSPQANALQLGNDLFQFPLPQEMVKVFEDVLIAQGKEDELAKLRAHKKEREQAFVESQVEDQKKAA